MSKQTHSHYLKIPYSIRQHYPGVAPSDWKEAIFRDVVGRDGVVIEHLAPNAEGARIAFHGNTFYLEVGREKSRPDTLYAFRIEPAKNPRSVPKTIHRNFFNLPSGHPAELDSVDDLFPPGSPSREGAQAAEPDSDDDVSLESQPSPLLLKLVAQSPDAVRARYRPGRRVKEPASAIEFLGQLSTVWKRHRLDRHTSLSGRQELQIKGITRPPTLPRKERDALLAAFGFDLLNRLALEYRDSADRLPPILEDLGSVCLANDVRAVLWSAMLGGLPPQDARAELHATSPALMEMALEGAPAERIWEDELLKAVRAVAARSADSSLSQLTEEAEASDDPVGYIARWASRLEFKGESAATEEGVAIDTRYQMPATYSQVSAPASAQRTISALDQWILRVCIPDIQPLRSARMDVDEIHRQLTAIPDSIDTIEHSLTLLSSISRLNEALPRWSSRLPDPKSLTDEASVALASYRRFETHLGGALDSFLTQNDLSPRDLDEISDLLARKSNLAVVPSWLWSSTDSSDSPVDGANILEVAQAAASPVVRKHLNLFLDAFDRLEETAATRWLYPPRSGDDVATHITRWYERSKEFLATIPPDMRPAVLADLSSLDDVEALASVADAQADLLVRLNSDAGQHIRQELGAAPLHERRQILTAYEQAADAFENEYGDPAEATYSALRTSAHKRLTANADLTTSQPAHPIVVQHNWTEQSGARASLVFFQPDPSQDYGHFDIPLVLETERPRSISVKLTYEVRGDHRNAWPRDWPNPEPADPFEVPQNAWRLQAPDRKYQFTLRVRVPVRTPRMEHPRLELLITAHDASNNRQLGPPQPLRWDAVERQPTTVTLQWSGATNPDYVRIHPIGPQAQAATLLDRLRAGGSVAVIAPRRFGKSTLVEYLLGAAEQAQLLIPPALVCTMYAGGTAFDYDSLWAKVHDDLQSVLGAGLPRTGGGGLPDASAFDHVRRAARQRGYKGIVLLFDEAQLFFPRQGGTTLGTRLKNTLERHWSRSDETSKVPLLIGMIGLPALNERAGADLMGLLSPIESMLMNEGELRRLLTGMTRGLQTTREARLRLAESAGNLFILRALLEKLVALVNRERRVWASYDDVVAVEEDLKRELQNGREETVASYIRDALNAAERVTDWEPIPSFPVAVAVAQVRQHRRPFSDCVDRAVALLNRWCEAVGSDGTSVAKYRSENVVRHLQQLQERRVIRDSDFSSSLLEAWLTGVGKSGVYDETFRTALFKGAYRHIPLPRGAEPVKEGGQARIFRVSDERGQLAYRLRRLTSRSDQEYFQHTIEMFDALRSSTLRTEPGGDHLFELIDLGLSADNAEDAVQVYRWVEGEDLASRKATLTIDMVVHLGVKLARALALLHQNSILHRDIRPANIVLDERLMRPVLIDFGFARRMHDKMNTLIGGDYCAPEVSTEPPTWSRAADVFALCATLRALLNPAEQSSRELAELLNRATAAQATQRPTAAELLTALEALEKKRELESKREEIWRTVRARVERDRHKAWFTEVLNKKRAHFEAMALGFYRAPLDRYREMADFLNQVAEAYHPPGHLTLKRLSLHDPENDSLTLLVALRNYDSHAGEARSREAKEAIEAFRRKKPDQQKSAFSGGVSVVESAVKLRSLAQLIDLFIVH